VIRLRLPPLRERVQDVPLLARHFMQRSARELGVEAKRLSDEAIARLATFSWPGNVRQLENVCHWLTVMAPAQTIEAKDLPPEVLAAMPSADAAVGAAPDAPPRLEAPPPPGASASVSASGLFGEPSPQPALSAPPPFGAPRPFGAPPAASAAPDPGYGAPRGVPAAGTVGAAGAPPGRPGWASLLEAEVAQMLAAQSARGGEPPASSEVMDQLTRTFESTIIRTALRHTRGRRIDAALRLGIGRNTITRKIQDLRLEDD
jgi:two-component system nitrogen regulation response regulator GlnG